MSAPAHALPPRLRRTWRQRLLIATCALLIVGCLTGAGGLSYFYVQLNGLERVNLADGILANEQPPTDPENFLLVGSDSRSFVEGGQDAQSFGSAGSVGGQRSDTVMLVRVDPKTKHAWMLSFPRDLYIPIAPDFRNDRINTAYDPESPQRLIETIKTNFNVPIHHYAEVNFAGFRNLVDTVGGVKLFVAGPIRDRQTGLNITDTGCVLFHGDQALSYVRSRQFQYFENGRWRSDPTGDLGRITRQQDFVRRAIHETLSKDLLNPARANRLIGVARESVKVDDELDLDSLLRLGRTFRSLDPNAVTQFQLPVVGAVGSGGASVLKIPTKDTPTVEAILEVFRGVPQETAQAPEATPEVLPAGVTVRVLNGSGISGQASDVTSSLRQAGFSTQAPGTTTPIARTTVRYAPGQQAQAALVARYLVNGADLQETSGLGGVDVVVVTATDFAGVLATPDPAPPATPTTTSLPVATTAPAAPEC
jgi:LCP family protein required for cell wall assembly